jgi:signal transduction histidine kinase
MFSDFHINFPDFQAMMARAEGTSALFVERMYLGDFGDVIAGGNIYMVLFLASIILFGFALFFLFASMRRNKRLRRLLQQRHSIIDQQKNDLEVAFKEMTILKDKAESANRTRSGFLANISHEMRTPLNGMIGLISLIKKTGLKEQQREYVNDTELMARNLFTLVNDILDYSKFESGSLALQQINFNLLQELSELFQVFRKKASEKDIQFITRLETSLPQYVKGDPVRLAQILNNLLQNAVKFTDKGSIRVQSSVITDILFYNTV